MQQTRYVQRICAALKVDALASSSASQGLSYALTSAVAVQAASRQIAKQSSVMDAQLFTIKQLLILREQIAPFEADFAVTEYDLDFSHMRDHLRRIMAGMCNLIVVCLQCRCHVHYTVCVQGLFGIGGCVHSVLCLMHRTCSAQWKCLAMTVLHMCVALCRQGVSVYLFLQQCHGAAGQQRRT